MDTSSNTDAFLPGPNPPTHLLTPEATRVLENYYQNIKAALHTLPDTATRTEFLNDVLTTAIENNGYGPWMLLDSYNPGTPNQQGYAVLRIAPSYRDPDDPKDKEVKRVDHDTLEHGFRSMRRRAAIQDPAHNRITGWVANVLQADLLNDAGIMDVVDALNIVEVALFGEVRYS